jgi:hypothetical protein
LIDPIDYCELHNSETNPAFIRYINEDDEGGILPLARK